MIITKYMMIDEFWVPLLIVKLLKSNFWKKMTGHQMSFCDVEGESFSTEAPRAQSDFGHWKSGRRVDFLKS